MPTGTSTPVLTDVQRAIQLTLDGNGYVEHLDCAFSLNANRYRSIGALFAERQTSYHEYGQLSKAKMTYISLPQHAIDSNLQTPKVLGVKNLCTPFRCELHYFHTDRNSAFCGIRVPTNS